MVPKIVMHSKAKMKSREDNRGQYLVILTNN